jgi:ABC-type lipoprotein release transport system permease subunit
MTVILVISALVFVAASLLVASILPARRALRE